VSQRESFRATTRGGRLGGWLGGDGEPLLLLHGGPGLSYEVLDDVAADVGEGFRIAAYQQRGLEPSTLEGPFSVEQEITDAIAVLDALGWERAWIAGHSWGGHLALRLVAAHPERLLGALSIDPIGVIGDGGTSGFVAEMIGRLPQAASDRVRELEQRDARGDATHEEAMESFELCWPCYFADYWSAPPMPRVRMSMDAHNGVMAGIDEGTGEVAAELAKGAVPLRFLAGGASPIPWGQACRATANLSERIGLTVVPQAGHLPWHEAPGCVREALMALRADAG
jgi:pimeloyl-ACP methyl ester carboxylesterase